MLLGLILEDPISEIDQKKGTPYLVPNTEKKVEILEKLKKLPEGSTVVMVQSTNFRLDDFRIRLRFNEEKTEISKCNPNEVRTIEVYNANESIHHVTSGL